jgi:hypothetical protein
MAKAALERQFSRRQQCPVRQRREELFDAVDHSFELAEGSGKLHALGFGYPRFLLVQNQGASEQLELFAMPRVESLP